VTSRRSAAPDNRALMFFIAGSMFVHALVFMSGGLMKRNVKVIVPVYNVTLVSSTPARPAAGGPAAQPPPPAPKAAPEPKAAAPVPVKPEPVKPEPVKKAEPKPAPKPEPAKPTKPAPAEKAKPVEKPKPAVEKPKEAPKVKESTPAAKSAQPAAKAEPARPFSDVLADVQKMVHSQPGPGGPSGNAGPGAAGGDAGGQLGALAVQIYAGQVQTAIQRRWAIPGNLAGSSATVQIGLKVGADGTVRDAWIDKSSGVSVLDESALRAVRAASPFSAPPETRNGIFEIYLRFTPSAASGGT
jgi:colicin import membrane protein